jgi:hypothetical protein
MDTTHPAHHTFLHSIIFILSRVWECVAYRRVLERVIEFIATLYTQLVTTRTRKHSAITIFTLYSSLLHTLVSSDFTSRILATDS